MSMTDPIADFLTHIRNATMRRHPMVSIPASRLKEQVAEVLKQEGFIEDWSTLTDQRGRARIVINLKYDDEGGSVIRGLKRVSRPGLRQHAGYRQLKPVVGGQGIAVVTTSHGVLTDRECRNRQCGGEVLCHVW